MIYTEEYQVTSRNWASCVLNNDDFTAETRDGKMYMTGPGGTRVRVRCFKRIDPADWPHVVASDPTVQEEVEAARFERVCELYGTERGDKPGWQP